MKKLWNILICILFNFGCSEEIAIEDNETTHAKVKETLYDESNGTFYEESTKTSENLTNFGYEIAHFNDTHVEVRNTFER